MNPAHQYVPWVVVNDQHTSSTENAVITNMVRYVCSVYKGSIKIDACNWSVSLLFWISWIMYDLLKELKNMRQ